jgi:folate-binding protein YgfZ
MLEETLPGYATALSRVGYYPVPAPGTLRVSGEDRLAFFQRQTTNDVNQLRLNHCLVTVLTSPTARILDVLQLIDEGDTLTVLTLAGHGADTARYLKSRIFFMDKVSLEDLSADYAQVDLEGTKAPESLNELGFTNTPALNEVVRANLGEEPCSAIGQRGVTGASYRLLFPSSAMTRLESTLEELGIDRISPDAYNTLRVESGLPAPGAELIEAYTPLETNLGWAISDHKGCYTGQEIIARQITYDKVTQHLVGLRLSAPAQPGEPVWAEGGRIGTVTSAVHSPRHGEIALAILKRPYHEAGQTVRVGNSASEELSKSAVVSKLPF